MTVLISLISQMDRIPDTVLLGEPIPNALGADREGDLLLIHEPLEMLVKPECSINFEEGNADAECDLEHERSVGRQADGRRQ